MTKIDNPCNSRTWAFPRGWSDEIFRPQGWAVRATFKSNYENFGQVIVTKQDHQREWKKKPEKTYKFSSGVKARADCLCSKDNNSLRSLVTEEFRDEDDRRAEQFGGEEEWKGFFQGGNESDNFSETIKGFFSIGGDKNVPAIYFEGQKIQEKKTILNYTEPEEIAYEFDPAERFPVRVYEGDIKAIKRYIRENLEERYSFSDDGKYNRYIPRNLWERTTGNDNFPDPMRCIQGEPVGANDDGTDPSFCDFAEPHERRENRGWNIDGIIYKLDADNYSCGGPIGGKQEFLNLCSQKPVPRRIQRVERVGSIGRGGGLERYRRS